MARSSTGTSSLVISPIKLTCSLVLSALMVFANAAQAGSSSSPEIKSTSAIGHDLFKDGEFDVTKTYAGNKTFTDKYTFQVKDKQLEKFDSLSTSLNYTNTTSVGCALLIFCGSSVTGFSNLTLTVSSASDSTTGSTTTGGTTTTNRVFIIPLLFSGTTSTTSNSVFADIDLLAGKYTISVSGTTLKDGGTYNLGVTAVSEPETLAMVGLGLGVMGLISRKRKSNASSSISYNFV